MDNGYKSEHVITQDKNHISWNKNHIPPPRKPRGFSRQSYRSLTEKRQRHSERITCVRPLQWPHYFTCMCFLGFIRGFRKYEKVFTHECYIPLWRCPRGIWYSWVNQFSYFSHQHAINVYCYIDRCELWGCIRNINSGISHVKYQLFPTGTTFT